MLDDNENSNAALVQRAAEGLALGRAVLARQSFSMLLGAELAAIEPGYAEIHLPITPDLMQQRGVVHGGAIAYLADNAQTFAGGSVLGEKVATLETKINYLRPALAGTLVARARLIGHGKRTAVTTCEIFARSDEGEIMVAAAQGTIMTLADPSAEAAK